MKKSTQVIHNNPSLADKLSFLPTAPGCYIYRGSKGEVLYVGKAVNLRSRVRSYFQAGAKHQARTTRMVRVVRDVEWIVTDSEMEALILECNLIKKHRPPFNVRLRDDKSYPYVCVTVKDPFPKVFFTRRPHFTPDGNRYFGPYTNARELRDTLRAVRRIFGIQSCKHTFTGNERMRPCLYYHLNQCLGPCTGNISKEEYAEAVERVCLMFEGKHGHLLKEMEQQMEDAAENLQYERAASLRDRIRAIRNLAERQKVYSTDMTDQDVIGVARDELDTMVHVFFIRSGRLVGQENFSVQSSEDEADSCVVEQFIKQYYQGSPALPLEIIVQAEPDDKDVIEEWLSARRGRKVRIHCPQRGEKRRMVELVIKNARLGLENKRRSDLGGRERGEQACLELADALGLEVPPIRMECYDISTLQGGYSVGSMVVFESGLPSKVNYRHFRIKTVMGQDDFAGMKEVITRRLAKAKTDNGGFSNLPDLMLIDGGKGQLGAALEALIDAEEEGVAVASLAKKEEEIFLPGRVDAIRLPKHTAALRLVQQIRDEAHRFALSYHRKLRGKGSLHSELDDVPGIGKTRRIKLLRHYGSVIKIKNATLEDLTSAPGMNRPSAETLYKHLHGELHDKAIE